MLAPDPRFERIDEMEGREFEAQVAELLELLGYEDVKQTSYYDKGADIVAIKDGRRIAVQVKRRSNSVGVDGVRQLIDGTKRYGCDRGLLVTNSYLTGEAIRSAALWNIEVWDRDKLAEYAEGEPASIDTSICAHCGRKVTPGVRDFCLTHRGRFGGFVYCFGHQARSQRRPA
jgi:Holliday junction resolvase-like predicted endonuclease